MLVVWLEWVVMNWMFSSEEKLDIVVKVMV